MATHHPPSSSFQPQIKTKFWVSLHLLLLFVSFCISPSLSFSARTTFSSSSSPTISKVPYTKHCNSIVPQSTPHYNQITKSTFPQLKTGYFSGGDRILAQNQNFTTTSPKALVFRTQGVYDTDLEDIVKIEGSLVFRLGGNVPSMSNSSVGLVRRDKRGRFRTRTHRFPFRRNRLVFNLNGYWSELSGKLCMVGSGSGYDKQGNLLDLSVVFKLDYPKNSTIFTSLVSGSLVSVDSSDSGNYFEPVSILAYSQRNYEYTMVSDDVKSEFLGGGELGKDLGLSLVQVRSICSMLLSSSVYELVYGSDCDGSKACSPIDRSLGGLPDIMSFNEVQCSDDQKLRLLIGFSNTSYSLYNQPLILGRMLVGEGVWDGDRNRLHIVACRVLNYTGSLDNVSVGNCSVRLSIWFPAILSIKSRSRVVGKLWSNRTVNESGYFDKIVFQNLKNRISDFTGLNYEYTEIERAVASCPKKTETKKRQRYPSVYSYDMKFDMTVTTNRRTHAWGYAQPLSVGDQFYEHRMELETVALTPATSVQMSGNHSSLSNISYIIHLTPDYQVGGAIFSSTASLNLNGPVEISAEGIYNTETGSLCMVGCRYVKSSHLTDCEILITVQFRPLDSKSSEHVKGTIESMRRKSDPLYFERLQLSAISMTWIQAKESVWRMDIEITMVLVSNTLICIFVGLQIFYVKKHPDVLPSVSFVMLVILTLGQMIPLVLNFEALFLTNRNRQNVMMGSGGWLEVNEVLVRIVTMISFLLQFRLLQLTWSSKSGDGNQKDLVLAEKKAIYVLLPLYVLGALIAWSMHWWNNSHVGPYQPISVTVYQEHSLWGDLRSYAGLLLDGFLLPQILFNVFWNSKDKALCPAFYVGITSVHLLPHAYDLYRAHRYVPYVDASYIYANPGGDFFSTAWDVIIPCGGLVFAILIYLQQQFGGCCIFPSRFRQSAAYEMVPVANGDWLDKESL